MTEINHADRRYVEQDVASGTRIAPRRIYIGNTTEALSREANRDLIQEDQRLRIMEDVVDMYDLFQFLLHGIQPRSDRLKLRVVEKPK